MKDSKKFWNECAEKYASKPIKDNKTYQKKLDITRKHLNPQSDILEFGCGSGATAITHAANASHVTAIDISEKMIAIAKRNSTQAGTQNITFQVGTLDDMIFCNSTFDAVLGLNILHLLKDVDATICQINAALKNDGVFISSTSLIGEVNFIYRVLIASMQFFGLAPHVSCLTKNELISKLTNTGFSIDFEWRTSAESIFLVARKTNNS